MQKLKPTLLPVYKSYNVLESEKIPQYSYSAPMSEIYDKVDIEIPGLFEVFTSKTNEVIITTPTGGYHLIDDILESREDGPYFVWYKGARYSYKLTVIE